MLDRGCLATRESKRICHSVAERRGQRGEGTSVGRWPTVGTELLLRRDAVPRDTREQREIPPDQLDRRCWMLQLNQPLKPSGQMTWEFAAEDTFY